LRRLSFIFSIPCFWLIVCAGMLSGCGTIANVLECGQYATLAPGWEGEEPTQRGEDPIFRIKFLMMVTNQEIHVKAFSRMILSSLPSPSMCANMLL
jgi:hypothetical protein